MGIGNVRIALGSAIKSLGGGRYGGWGIPFGLPFDCVGDVFWIYLTLVELFLTDRGSIPMMLSHGADERIGKRIVAKAEFELRPQKGLWIEWGFIKPSDPDILKIRELIEDGVMALSSAAAPHMVIREKKDKYSLIKQWPVAEISLTSSPCALSGRTTVGTLKDFQGLTLDEMVRRRGMTEAQILREEYEERHYRVERLLEGKCNDEWMSRQRRKCQISEETDVARRDYFRMRDEQKVKLAETDRLLTEAQKIYDGQLGNRSDRAAYNAKLTSHWAGNKYAAIEVGRAMQEYDAATRN